MGMPGSGKSTFIAALRHLLLAGDVPTELLLTILAEEEKHLNKLEADWLALREVPRTKPATEGWVEFHLRDPEGGREATVLVPDLRGEAFEQPASLGRCESDLHMALAEADGFILFTNAENDVDSLMLSDLGDLLGPLADGGGGPPPPFRPEDMPEEVKVVEFLQMANRRPLTARRRRIAVMISAWDTVPAGTDPGTWLAEHRPMLDQFLAHNADLWETRVYGVSAQGGRLPADRARLRGLRKPSERIAVIGHGAARHDLTAPLRWVGTV
jgi:hypothetical protein